MKPDRYNVKNLLVTNRLCKLNDSSDAGSEGPQRAICNLLHKLLAGTFTLF